MTAPLLVLDLDGTLVDTAADLVATLNAILAQEGLPPLAFDVAIGTVGQGARVMIERALVRAGREADAVDVGRLTDDFIAYYGSRIAEASRPYPGALAALDRFAAAGWRLSICTNKTAALADKLMAELGLADRFAAICGQDTFPFRKPDPRHITETVRRAGGDPARAVMVGDSDTDIAAATAAGVPVVAVAYGYGPITGPPHADTTIDHFDELWSAVAGLVDGGG